MLSDLKKTSQPHLAFETWLMINVNVLESKHSNLTSNETLNNSFRVVCIDEKWNQNLGTQNISTCFKGLLNRNNQSG